MPIQTRFNPHTIRRLYGMRPAHSQDLSVLFVGTVDFSGIGLAPARLSATIPSRSLSIAAPVVPARRRAGQSPAAAAAAADGKAMRKSGVHVMRVFLQDYWQFIALFEVAANKNELPAFEDHLDGFLARHPWLSPLTFSALFCQRSVVKHLVGKGKKPSSR